MMGSSSSHKGSRWQFERDAIRLLCSEMITAETRGQLAGLLQDYAFKDGLNHVVYEAIVGVGVVPAGRLRELLPGLVTNMGFPDFDLKEYLARGRAREEDIDKLFESLLELMEAPAEEGKRVMGQSA